MKFAASMTAARVARARGEDERCRGSVEGGEPAAGVAAPERDDDENRPSRGQGIAEGLAAGGAEDVARRRERIAARSGVAREIGAYGSDDHYDFVLDQLVGGLRAATARSRPDN